MGFGFGYAFEHLEPEIAVFEQMDCGLPIAVRGLNRVIYRRLRVPTRDEILARREPNYVGIQDESGNVIAKVEPWRVPSSAFNRLFDELNGPLAAKRYADAMKQQTAAESPVLSTDFAYA